MDFLVDGGRRHLQKENRYLYLKVRAAHEIRNSQPIDRAPFSRIPRISSQCKAQIISENFHCDAHASNLPIMVVRSIMPAIQPESSFLRPDDCGSFPKTPEHILEFWHGNGIEERFHKNKIMIILQIG
jgi:hypothetical protein